MSARSMDYFAGLLRQGIAKAEEVAKRNPEAPDVARGRYLADWADFIAGQLTAYAAAERTQDEAHASATRAGTAQMFSEACAPHGCDEKCEQCAGRES